MSQLVELEIPHISTHKTFIKRPAPQSLVNHWWNSWYFCVFGIGSQRSRRSRCLCAAWLSRLPRNSGKTGASRIFAHALKPQVIKAKRLQQLFPATCPWVISDEVCCFFGIETSETQESIETSHRTKTVVKHVCLLFYILFGGDLISQWISGSWFFGSILKEIKESYVQQPLDYGRNSRYGDEWRISCYMVVMENWKPKIMPHEPMLRWAELRWLRWLFDGWIGLPMRDF